ncbi:MAG: type III-B CRISPR module-associated protein Cmr5 [Desulfomonile sp.]|jgi:CRISPR-associated protein Cmr5
MNTTLAQERSLFALEELKKIGKVEKFDKLVSSLPAMILQNGFGQALAFLLAKGSTEKNAHHRQAFDIVALWLKKRGIITKAARDEVMQEISSLPQGDYLRAQEETLAILEWLKRYANAGLFS